MSRKRKALRPAADIANDFSEGLPVTTSELRRLVKWERRNLQYLQNRHNALRDACVKVGLILISNQPTFDALQIIMHALRSKK